MGPIVIFKELYGIFLNYFCKYLQFVRKRAVFICPEKQILFCALELSFRAIWKLSVVFQYKIKPPSKKLVKRVTYDL
jgi:hypothetical protein